MVHTTAASMRVLPTEQLVPAAAIVAAAGNIYFYDKISCREVALDSRQPIATLACTGADHSLVKATCFLISCQQLVNVHRQFFC